jgi:hypothetical protein
MNPITIKSKVAFNIVQRRRLEGTPHISKTARNAPPPPIPHGLALAGRTSEEFDDAVVATVRTLVPFPPGLRATLVGFRLQVGRLCAPEGDSAREQVNSRVPV